jgi:MoxR-like ATPase
MQGNDFVSPSNITAVFHDCIRHRIILSYKANAEGISADTVLDEILKEVAVIA